VTSDEVSSCLSILMQQLGFCWTEFCEFDIWVFFKNLSSRSRFIKIRPE